MLENVQGGLNLAGTCSSSFTPYQILASAATMEMQWMLPLVCRLPLRQELHHRSIPGPSCELHMIHFSLPQTGAGKPRSLTCTSELVSQLVGLHLVPQQMMELLLHLTTLLVYSVSNMSGSRNTEFILKKMLFVIYQFKCGILTHSR